MQNTDPLIRTKLRLPFTRSELVARLRLKERFAEGLRGPLTLITAPAGFGKTTLMVAGFADCEMPVAWLSLDSGDNQAGRFLNYLVEALINADGMVRSEAIQLLSASHEVPFEVVLTSLINDLDAAGEDIALVLDDYQFISSQAVHTAVAFLLEHGPKTLHLVIASRSDPPLPLARLRARGQAVELRTSDLRFTVSESTQFLNEVMGFRLSAIAVAMLEERTEGWIAGLQMAALSMRDRDDVLGFIEGFSGTHRYILDYLLEEVLAGQSPDVQRFLLCTSILEHLSASICDAVMASDDTPQIHDEVRLNQTLLDNHSQSQVLLQWISILEYLEQANLFLVPLDDERIWYRYHHLFADLLRARLDQTYPGLAPRLHARASAWFEHEGMMVEAVNHALAAGENDRAAYLVEEYTTDLLAKGELNALMGWIEALPAALRLARPWLCIHQSYALAFAGRLAEIEPLLATAEANVGSADRPDKVNETYISSPLVTESHALFGAVNAIRAMTAVMKGQDTEAISRAQQAMELLPASNLWDRAAAAWVLGYAQRSLGHLPESRSAFEEQIRLGRDMGNIWTLVTGLTDLAQVLRAQGQLWQARAVFDEALTEASQQGARSLGYIARMEAGLASVLFEQNELEAANQLLTEAITHARQWPNPNHLAYAYVLQFRVQIARGNFQDARTSLSEADRIRRVATLTRPNRRMVEANLVRLWLALQTAGDYLTPDDPLGDQADALRTTWRSELVNPVESLDESAETAALSLARMSLATGNAEEALTLLTRVTQSALTDGHINVAIGSLVLTAIARNYGGTTPNSNTVLTFTELEEALSLAEPGGYVRVFLDEGRPMHLLLAQWLAHGGSSPLRSYTIRLLSLFDTEPDGRKAMQEKVPATGGLVEPLSQREMEVLHLIAQGTTNQEIARQLIVAPGTVKAHTSNIYRKLDVANRTEAVARARQLGILP